MSGPATSLDALYDDAPCGLLLADADGLLLHANATACAWLGFTLPELAGIVRGHGDRPALIGVHEGRAIVGLSEQELSDLLDGVRAEVAAR